MVRTSLLIVLLLLPASGCRTGIHTESAAKTTLTKPHFPEQELPYADTLWTYSGEWEDDGSVSILKSARKLYSKHVYLCEEKGRRLVVLQATQPAVFNQYQITPQVFRDGKWVTSGPVRREYRNGTSAITGMENGKPHGMMRSVKKDGSLYTECHYKNGVLHGRSRIWDRDSNRLKVDQMIEDGEIVSCKRWNSKGELITDVKNK